MRIAGVGKWMVCIALGVLLVGSAPAGFARGKADPDKHARKIEKKLAHFKKGTLIRVVLTNSAESTGTLNELGDESFTMTNVETNAPEKYRYAEVDSVGKGSEAIGRGSEKHHRRGLF